MLLIVGDGSDFLTISLLFLDRLNYYRGVSARKGAPKASHEPSLRD